MATDSYPQNHGSLAGLSSTDHHTQYPLLATSTAAARPTAPWRFGRLHYATDTSAFSFDQGAGWAAVPTTTAAQTWAGLQTFSTQPSMAGFTVVPGDNWVPSTVVNSSIAAGSTMPHYGFGFADFNDGAGGVGANMFASAYYGISFVTNGTHRMRIQRFGAIRTQQGIRAATAMVNDNTTSTGVDLFIDSLFA